MRSSCVVFVIVASALVVTACGSSKEEKAAKQATEAAAAVAKQGGQAGGASADVAKGMQEMAKGFEQMTGQGGPAPVEPVSFRELQVVLPEFAGWEKGQPTGEKMSVPIAISQSEVVYTKDEGRLTAKVVDTGFRQMFFLPYTMMMAVGYEKESSDGYEKATMVGTYPAFEKWDQSSKRGELAVAVGKRFFVSIEGENIQNTAVLRELMSHVDLNKLAAMK
jgi:hypothetical protein